MNPLRYNLVCFVQDYKIQSSWYQRHAAMTPLFVETQLSTQAALPGHGSVGANDSSVGSRHVRMTQDVTSFAPTQASGMYENQNKDNGNLSAAQKINTIKELYYDQYLQDIGA